MKREYRTLVFFKILYGLSVICFNCFAIYQSVIKVNESYGILILPIFGLTAAVLIILNIFKRKVVISGDSVSYTNIWGSSTIPIAHIGGYRTTRNAIYIYPDTNDFPVISISDYLSINDSSQLTEWLHDSFTDIHKDRFERTEQHILADAIIGSTVESRQDKYENAVIYSLGYNCASAVLFVMTVFLKIDSFILDSLLMVYPLVGLGLIFFTRGLIRFIAKLETSAYRSVWPGILTTAMCLNIAILSHMTFSTDQNLFWLVIIGVLVTFTLSYLIIWKVAKSAIGSQLILIIIFAAVYGHGSVIGINYMFDNSKERNFSVPVMYHFFSEGDVYSKSNNYSSFHVT